MIRADLLLEGIGDLATLAGPPPPRVGRSAGDLGRIDGAGLAIDGGRFVCVGRERAVRREVRLRSSGRSIDLAGAAVVPGFVDAHTHLLFGGDRSAEVGAKVRGASYVEIARRGGGIYATVRATRRATTSALADAARGRLRRMLASGTTTAEVKSGYALTHAGELRLLGLIPGLARTSGVRLVPTYLGAHAVPPGRERSSYVEEIVGRTLPEVARRRLARFCDVFCEPGFFPVPDGARVLRAAQRLGLGAKVHADEFRRSGGGALAARLGAVSAEHLLETPDADRARLARAGVTAVLLPVTPFSSLASSRSPGREMVDAGVAVALGSDLSPNSWIEAMPIVLAHAVYSARLTPAEAIVAATVNAAHAIGVADRAGSIAVGREADLAVFDLPSVERIPYRIGSLPTRVYRRGIRVSPA
ncbi:MAG TPA: imidazolonepropionase [Thermoplasmata archaeon]|nr:imidazolonepropionase [Thermoplasmata archaeon]